MIPRKKPSAEFREFIATFSEQLHAVRSGGTKLSPLRIAKLFFDSVTLSSDERSREWLSRLYDEAKKL